jgi:hypothetical protein
MVFCSKSSRIESEKPDYLLAELGKELPISKTRTVVETRIGALEVVLAPRPALSNFWCSLSLPPTVPL